MRRKFLKAVLVSCLAISTMNFACTVPAWVNTAEGIAKIFVPIAGSLASIIDPPIAPLVTLIEGGFTALLNTLDTYKAQPTNTNLQAAEVALEAINANLTQLENAAQIKNPNTDARIKAVVALIGQGVAELAALLPPPTIAPPASGGGLVVRARASQARGYKASYFKQQYQKITAGDSRWAVIY